MRKFLSIAAIALTIPLASAQAQVYDLLPTDGGGGWQVKCTVIAVDAPPVGPCNGAYSDAARVTVTPSGWASVPVAGPGGSAYYISPFSSASIWAQSPNENPHYEYTFKTTFDVLAYDPAYAALFLNLFRFDNYFTGWSLNGSAFSSSGINPPPLAANGKNWETPFQLSIPGDGFVVGQNTLELRVLGNGRTDAILTQGTYTTATTTTPEPATMLLLATGLAGLAIVQRRRRRA